MYRDASRVLDQLMQGDGKRKGPQQGLKSLALAERVKNKSKTYAVVCETLKYRKALDAVLETAEVDPKKLARSKGLLYCMLYDHLFGKGIQGGGAVKRSLLAVDARLRSALELVMQAQGADEPLDLVEERVRNAPKFPRYARVNLAKASMTEIGDWFPNLEAPVPDALIPYLLRFPNKTDLHDHDKVEDGSIILQDKSSCMPAHALHLAAKEAGIESTQCIDATAAPGNKTSQLASLGFSRVFAFDKSSRRLDLLKKRMEQAGVLNSTVEAQCQDFLKVQHDDEQYAKVGAILLDPSCSGSGMIGRVDHLVQSETLDTSEEEQLRVERLATFQQDCLDHALSFPQVKLVSYSTCSIHVQENEKVVAETLAAHPSFELVHALPKWSRRGLVEGGLTDAQAKCVVRVDPVQDETCGFFVAIFRRVDPSTLAKRAKMKERRKRRRKSKRNNVSEENTADDKDVDSNEHLDAPKEKRRRLSTP